MQVSSGDTGLRNPQYGFSTFEKWRTFAPHSTIVEKGDVMRRFIMIRSGWAASSRYLFDGRRSVLHFYLPGDFVSPIWNRSAASLDPIEALTVVKTVNVNPDDIEPDMVEAMERRHRSCMANHGMALNQSAEQRIAHLFLELEERLRNAGEAVDDGFDFPATQILIAHHLGMTPVHVNRTLRSMIGEGLIEFKRHRLTIFRHNVLRLMSDYHSIN